MGQLIPENTTRKLDSIGRITLPKSLRDRMFLFEDAELELFTAIIDGRKCICLAKVGDDSHKEEDIEAAKAILMRYGIKISEEG